MLEEYDIAKMKNELLEKLDQFLNGTLPETELKIYAQEQFEKWDGVQDALLPPANENDRIYWSAIYNIWNFNDDPPEYHPALEDLKQCRRWLIGEEQFPVDEIAKRPSIE